MEKILNTIEAIIAALLATVAFALVCQAIYSLLK